MTAIIEKTTTNNGDPGPVPGTERVCKHVGTEDLYTGAPQTPTLQSPCFVWTIHISKWKSCTSKSVFQDPETIRIGGRISLGLIRAWDTWLSG